MTSSYTLGKSKVLAVLGLKGAENNALKLAIGLRRIGETVDSVYSSSPKQAKKRFFRFKGEGATDIFEVREDETVRWWSIGCRSVDATVDEVLQYYRWLNDDWDEVPDPREELLSMNRVNTEESQS